MDRKLYKADTAAGRLTASNCAGVGVFVHGDEIFGADNRNRFYSLCVFELQTDQTAADFLLRLRSENYDLCSFSNGI